MKVIHNSKLNEIPLIKQNVDSLSNVPYKVAYPLCPMNDALYIVGAAGSGKTCLLYTSPSPRDRTRSRMPSSA